MGLDIYGFTNPLGPSISSIEKYQRNYQARLIDIDTWLKELPQSIELRSRFFLIYIKAGNVGGGPAEQLRLDSEASEGVFC
jgi:hypothetical protein